MGVYWDYTYLVNGSTLEICRMTLVGFVANFMVGWWFLLMLRHLILRYPRIQPLTNEFTNVHGGFCVCSLPAVDPWGRRFPTFLGGMGISTRIWLVLFN